MHLKRIEIQGFKSFPEYTLIEFDKGMTAIVGPNGSGKSNVTDAIRWVLGEQSVRTLRGGKMEDVIFNGTQSRRAMNYAEVSMTIDNSDGLLGIDYSEVQVTRRLYRSGESEYQLNHVNCRLKDIVTLIMDTGLGKDGYSIVGQGRVDEILSTRSEDRRKVLEEASGIVKYKVRKDEAERKLLSAEQNLIRITDILTELGDQVGPLLEQSEKARQYHRVYDEWKALDIGLALFMIDRNQAFLSASAMETNSLSDDIRAQEDSIIEMRNKNRNLSEKSSLLEESLEEYRTQLKDLSESIHGLQSSIAVTSDRRSQLSGRIDASENQEGGAQSEMDRLEIEYQNQCKKISDVSSQRDEYASALTLQESKMTALLASLDQSQNKLAQLRKKMEDLQEDLFANKEQAQKLASDVQLLDARSKTLSQERTLSVTELDSLRLKLEESDKALSVLVKKSSQDAVVFTEKANEMTKHRTTLSDVTNMIEQKKRELDNCHYRIRTLDELEKSREGYQEPVRRLMSASEKDTTLSERMIGVLGELVRVPSEYETAIEIALGQAVHHIVTQSEADASFLIEYLKKNQMGRATFMPIDVVKTRELESGYLDTVRKSEGFLGVASDLLTFPDHLRGIIGNLLSRIVITDTLQNAIKIANKTAHSFRLVTREGDVVNPGGSLTGGSIRKQGTSLLGRAREIEAMHASIPSLQKELASYEDDRDSLERKIKDTAREQALLDEKIHALSMDRVRAEATHGQLIVENEKLKARMTLIEKELTEISSRRSLAVDDQQECKNAITDCEKEILLVRQKLSQTDDQNKESQELLEAHRVEIGNLRISIGSIEESLRGANEIAERILHEKEGYSDGLLRRRQERDHSRLEVSSLLLEEEEMNVKKDAFQANEADILAKMKALQLEKEELEQELAGFIDRLTSAATRLSSLQAEQARMQSKTERFEVEVDEYKNRMWEDHALTYDNAQSFALEIDNPQPLQRRITELKNEIREIGPVNLGAIEEYDRVNERYTFMQKQKDDIESAKANLSGIIADLVTEMKQQFLTHFEQINENFKVVFSDLFNGGTADIILENEEDVLSCGIDIRAQPPGKKLQSLTLLSGGERCLTAIALLFAILQLRPSPFCVLDEVEAALDDVNVNRFTDFVRRYTSKSQFILVTHRKGTMEACDRMYGVTMQERGISKILSMRLGDS
jgi:chromosome segregation protein